MAETEEDDGLSTTVPPTIFPPAMFSAKEGNPCKYVCKGFLFKSLIVTVFLLLVPLQAPDFVDDNSLFNRSWELVHLVLVGIAVSYGLFSSRRNEAFVDEGNRKSDNTQSSYVSSLLHVPSVVFDDGDFAESSSSGSGFRSGSGPGSGPGPVVDDGNVQAWSSQYSRNEPPMLAVAKQGPHAAIGGKRDPDLGGLDEKTLLLPVRSLKSGVHHGKVDAISGIGDDSKVPWSSDSLNLGLNLKEDSKESRYRGVNSHSVDDKDYDCYVYGDRRVPINGSNTLKLTEEQLLSKERKDSSQSCIGYGFGCADRNGEVSGCPSSTSNSIRKDCMTRKSDGEFGVLNGEVVDDRAADDSDVLPSPIPWRSRSSRMDRKEILEEYENRRSYGSQSSRFVTLESPRGILEDDEGRRRVSKCIHRPPPPPPPPPPPRALHKSQLRQSSSCSYNHETSMQKELKHFVCSEAKDYSRGCGENFVDREYAEMEAKARDSSLFVGKSVRTIRTSEAVAASKTATAIREMGTGKVEMASTGAKTVQTTNRNESTTPSFTDCSKATSDFLDQLMIQTNNDDVEQLGNDEYSDKTLVRKRKPANIVDVDASYGITDEGPDVDKKADEFIAKFREQIRLQRIESIKRSTRQQKKESSR